MPGRQARKRVSPRFQKRNWALSCSSLNVFYLSIVEVIQNGGKANFVTLYDRNLSSKQVRYIYNVGSVNDSGINGKKCARRNGLKLRSANNAGSHFRPQSLRFFWSRGRRNVNDILNE